MFDDVSSWQVDTDAVRSLIFLVMGSTLTDLPVARSSSVTPYRSSSHNVDISVLMSSSTVTSRQVVRGDLDLLAHLKPEVAAVFAVN